MAQLVLVIAFFVLAAALEDSVQYFYCGHQTFLNTPISVSKGDKFLIDMTSNPMQNITMLSDPSSFQTEVTGCIVPLEEISYAIGIEIRYRSLPKLHSGAIQNLLNLKVLKMEHCEIQEVSPGAFIVLPQIDTLFLRHNKIEKIEMGVFNNLQVKRLFLSHNNINVILPDALNHMPKLSVVELDNNKLKSWNTDWFAHSPNVETLSLNSNLLKSLPANAFGKLKNSYSTTIRLSNNQIIYIHPTAFSNLNLLYTLWLDNNNLRELPDGVFKNLERIYVISLAGNQISCLSDEFLYGLKAPEVILHVEDNRGMDCECLKQIEKWARIRDLFFTRRYVKVELSKRKVDGLVCE